MRKLLPMFFGIFFSLATLVLTGCATTKIVSIGRPVQTSTYNKVLVMFVSDLATQVKGETLLVKSLQKYSKAQFFKYSDMVGASVVSRDSEVNDARMREGFKAIAQKEKMDAALFVFQGDSSSRRADVYVPILKTTTTSVTGTVGRSDVDLKGRSTGVDLLPVSAQETTHRFSLYLKDFTGQKSVEVWKGETETLGLDLNNISGASSFFAKVSAELKDFFK